MIQALGQPLSFEEFLNGYPDNGKHYELIDGEVIELRPEGDHIYSLVDGLYQLQQFRAEERLVSTVFPNLALTAAEVVRME